MKVIQLKDKNELPINPVPAFPVGYIYISHSSMSPAEMFGGTWEQIKDCFLLGAGSKYTAGTTGGSAETTQSTANLPAHSHSKIAYYNTNSYSSTGNLERFSTSTSTAGSLNTNTSTSAGGSQSHNNMPPYLAVYVWKKVEG